MIDSPCRCRWFADRSADSRLPMGWISRYTTRMSRCSRSLLIGSLGAALLWNTPASAVITQVDGTVLPVSDRLQIALDRSVALGGRGLQGSFMPFSMRISCRRSFKSPKIAMGSIAWWSFSTSKRARDTKIPSVGTTSPTPPPSIPC